MLTSIKKMINDKKTYMEAAKLILEDDELDDSLLLVEGCHNFKAGGENFSVEEKNGKYVVYNSDGSVRGNYDASYRVDIENELKEAKDSVKTEDTDMSFDDVDITEDGEESGEEGEEPDKGLDHSEDDEPEEGTTSDDTASTEINDTDDTLETEIDFKSDEPVPSADDDELMNVELNLRSNTQSDVLPVAPAAAQDIMDEPIDDDSAEVAGDPEFKAPVAATQDIMDEPISDTGDGNDDEGNEDDIDKMTMDVDIENGNEDESYSESFLDALNNARPDAKYAIKHLNSFLKSVKAAFKAEMKEVWKKYKKGKFFKACRPYLFIDAGDKDVKFPVIFFNKKARKVEDMLDNGSDFYCHMLIQFEAGWKLSKEQKDEIYSYIDEVLSYIYDEYFKRNDSDKNPFSIKEIKLSKEDSKAIRKEMDKVDVPLDKKDEESLNEMVIVYTVYEYTYHCSLVIPKDVYMPDQKSLKESQDILFNFQSLFEGISLGNDAEGQPAEDTKEAAPDESNAVTAAVNDKVDEANMEDEPLEGEPTMDETSDVSGDSNKEKLFKKLSTLTKNIEDIKASLLG